MYADIAESVKKKKKKLNRMEKFEIYGEVLIEKTVTANGRAGRIYLPMEWIGKTVKIVKIIR